MNILNKGETSHPLKVSVEKHQKERHWNQVWLIIYEKGGYQLLWYEVKIIENNTGE